MTEILTESFCERCGTRYTFEPVQGRRGPFGAIGTLGRGFRHFVTDPGSSLDEAFAVARSESEQRSTTHALEAFHRTFNFCLTCRQYTCGDCWNAVEGRCLTCAPTPDSVTIPEPRMDTAVLLPPMDLASPAAPITVEGAIDLETGPWIGSEAELLDKLGPIKRPEPEAEAEAWPEADAIATTEAGPEADTGAAPEEVPAEAPAVAAELEAELPMIEAEPVAEAIAEAEPPTDLGLEPVAMAPAEVAAEAEPEAAAEAVADLVAETEPTAEVGQVEAVEASLAFEPGQNLDEQIAEYERRVGATPEVEPQPEPVAVEPEPVAAELEPVAAEPEPLAVEPQPEAVAVEAEPVAIEPEAVAVEPEPEPVFVAAAPMVVEPEPEPVAAQAPEPEPVAAEPEPEPEPVAAQAPEPEPVAAEPEPEPVAAQAPEPEQEPLPAAAAAATPPAPVEPIPTAIGKPIPASVVDGPLAWPDPGLAAAAFEPAWPDVPTPRRPAPPPEVPATVELPPLPPPPPAALRRTGANLPSVTQAAQPVPAHACPSCGLSLSASARFCRRCGTAQQVAAPR